MGTQTIRKVMRILIQFENKPLLFQDPDFIISCTDPAALTDSFQQIEIALKRGYYLAGFLSYEAGYFSEEKLKKNKTYDFPLICLGAYKAPQRNNLRPERSSRENILENLRLNISRDRYNRHIQAIRGHIAEGDVYQITYCLKLLFSFRGDPFSLYNTLLKEQPVPYPAYIETAGFHILSLSPEMFIKKRYSRIVTKPMKGTWQRGRDILSDAINRIRFQYDEKNRAENLMIADLLRNDLGRIGTRIKAPRLFEISGYKKLFQMTSTVTADIDREMPVYRLLSAIFPSGSVTGAPKIRAMEIIRELEGEERLIYTGAIGYITPKKDMFFNIPIRTLLIRGTNGEMGIGGGIVWDSTEQGEWDEGLLKARFLTDIAALPINI